MFYAKMKQDGQIIANLYHDFQDYVRDTFSPEVETLEIIPFTVHGANYAERQNSVRETAIEYQAANYDVNYDLSMGELWHIGNWFEKMGKRYGLLKEFRENAIC